VLRFSEATAFDDFGRVTIRDYSDGTHEQFQYGCCGLEYSVDREGIRTDFYYDDFRQLESTKRAGITTKTFTEFVDDKLNHVTVRLGTDDSPVEQRREVRDLAGRILSVIEQGGTTLFAEAVLPTGEIVKTTTYPDGGTRIETYARDGRLTEVAGTAVAHVKYEENVSSLYWFGDYHTREIKVGDDNEETEWVMTFPDLLGRPLYTVNADTYGAPGNHTYIDYSYAESLDPKVIRVSDEDGFQKVYSYNERGELSEQASDLDWSSEIEHDGIDRVTRITRSVTTRDGGTPVQRTTVEGWPEEEVDAPLQLSQTDISLDGLTTWRTEAGATTKAVTTYGPVAGTRTVTVTYPDNTSLARVFLNGRLQSETRRDSAAQTMTALTYGYDEHGRLETVTDALGRITTTSYYPGTDRAHTVTTPDPDSTRSGSGYDAQTTTYGYDEAGRVNSVQAHDGSLTHTTYWPSGQVKRVWGGRTYPQEYTYDSQGRVKTLTTWQDFAGDTRKATTTWNYNALRGWLDNKRYADGHGPSYTYWTSGRPDTRQWARTHNGQPLVTTYDYNDAGDLKEIAYSDDTPLVSLTYDRLGRLHTTTDAAGLLTRSYDPVSLRLEGEAYSGTGLLSGRSITRGYDSLNRLESVVTDTGHAVDYDYNNAGRLDAINHGIHSAKYTYKAGVGSVETVTVKRSGADRVKHERITDALGRVGQVKTVTLGNAAVQRDYTYNHANQRTRIEQEDTRRWAFGHDDLGQVISAEKRLADNTTPLPGYSFGYTFDTIGNRTATAVNGRPATYLRDAGFLNQYTSRTVPGVVDVRGEAYADAMITVNSVAAARTGKDFYKEVSVSNGSAAVNTAITIEAVIAGTPPESVTEVRTAFSAQATESFTHDDDGNLTSDGRWSYTWDAENRLFAMETVAAVAAALPTLKQRLEFSYDAQGRRIHKLVKLWNASTSTWTTSAGQRFLYDGWNLITETDALNSTVLRTHVWGLDLSETAQGAGGVGGLLWSSAGGSTFAASSDANGNIVAYVNTATVIVAGRADYGAFGEAVMRTGVANTLPFGFSTKYIDNETDMLYYGLRYYNPSIGRWLSRDPIEENGGVNLYGMIGNNPVNYLDYLGLQERSPFCDCILKSFVENSSLWSLASNRVMQIEEAYENTLNQIKNGLRDPSQIKLALLTNGSVPILTRVDGSIVDAASVADALLKLTGNPAEKFGSMVGYQSLAVDSGNLAIDIANGDPSASLSAVKVGYTVGTSAFTGIIFREATAALGMSRGSVMTGIVALPLAGFGFGIDALRDDYSYNSAVKTLNGVKSRALYELKLQVQIYSSATERDMRYLKRYNCLPE
jgi:RHS repeat-associated protein